MAWDNISNKHTHALGKNSAGRTDSTSENSGYQEDNQRQGKIPRNYWNLREQCEGVISFCMSVKSASCRTFKEMGCERD